jgi:hypothetical protein
LFGQLVKKPGNPTITLDRENLFIHSNPHL